MEVATTTGLRPADFPIGSPQSRAAARSLIEQRDTDAMGEWITVSVQDLKYARVFAEKLQSQDSTSPFKVRLIVKSAKDARNQRPQSGLSLVFTDGEQAIRLTRLLAEKHGGVVIQADAPGPRKSKV